MNLEPWYKVVTPRKELREGRSFNPDEFAIHLEQVVDGRAPEDYRDPSSFFSRTCFTRALTEHCGMVLRRLSGETAGSAPVLTLVTQFGGGKTHTLTALYHLASLGPRAAAVPGVGRLLESARLEAVPAARVAVFAGNAWDPQPGRETPWVDLARQLAGDAGVAALGARARTTPPGTQALARVFEAAGAPVLVLFDEVLNFVNRHRDLAEPFHSFIQNLTVAMTGTTHGAAVISLPRSQVEMTDWDVEWQARITKVVRRVAKDLIVNDEGEVAEVIRRRLFEEVEPRPAAVRRACRAYAAWCFERRALLPGEWTTVDASASDARAVDALAARFETCYPFHPAAISVFQRKWQTLGQYQQTRGTLAMLAQWVSWAYRDGFQGARREPLVTLGSAPLEVADFRSVVLGQLGEPRLAPAIEVDLAGARAHARSLDADTSGPLKDIHRRVGAAIFFESSGGQVDRVAHLPELRFAIGEPAVDTTSVDNAAMALEARSFFLRRVGSDGFRISHRATLKKVVNDRLASLDEETEVKPAVRKLVGEEFERGKSVPLSRPFPADGGEVDDSPRLTLVVLDPDLEWDGSSEIRQQLADWTRRRGSSPRLYPGALVWCLKKPGRELRRRVEAWLAWQRVRREVSQKTLGEEVDSDDLGELAARLREAEDAARDEVWASYRYVVLLDPQERDGLKVVDLGAGHSGGGETLCGRVIAALKSSSLLNESVGAGYLERNWPPAFRASGAWPLTSLRQSLLDGSLPRLLDADAVLRSKIPELVARGDLGLASGDLPDGAFARVWFNEPVPHEEVAFEPGVFLLTKQRARALAGAPVSDQGGPMPRPPEPPAPPAPQPKPSPTVPEPAARPVTLQLSGSVPLESWNRLGQKLVPRLRSGRDAAARVTLTVSAEGAVAASLEAELRQALDDIGLGASFTITRREAE